MSRPFPETLYRRRRDWTMRVQGALWAAIVAAAVYFTLAGAARWLF